jgi:hypothetical protein
MTENERISPLSEIKAPKALRMWPRGYDCNQDFRCHESSNGNHNDANTPSTHMMDRMKLNGSVAERDTVDPEMGYETDSQ